MASFEQRGSTTRVVVSLGTGKKKTATFDTLAEAKAWAARQERRKALGQLSSTSGLTVRDVFEGYTDIAEQQDSGRENAMRLAKWSQDPLADMKLSALTTHDINEWIARRLTAVNEKTGAPITGSTVNRELNLMSAAFTWAVKTRKWIAANPCSGANRPANNRPRHRPLLTPAELEAICITTGYAPDAELTTLTSRVGACFLLSLETGMRSGEVLRLRPQDYDKTHRVIHVTALEKGGRKSARSGRAAAPGRKVPLTERAVEILDQLLESMPEGQTPAPGLMHPPYVVGMNDSQRDALWRKARDKACIEDLHYHDTKHEAATKLSKFLDVLALSHAIGTKDLRLLRDTYYNNDAREMATRLPAQIGTSPSSSEP